MLLKSVKNKIFEALKDSQLGIDAYAIEFKTSFGQDSAKISAKVSDGLLNFILLQSERDYDFYSIQCNQFSPGYHYREPYGREYHHITVALQYFGHWEDQEVTKFISEQQEVDLFDSYFRAQQLLQVEDVDYEDTSYFTIDQRRTIQLGFEEIKALIASKYAQNNEQIALVNQRLDYLSEATERLNKTDWKGIFISTVLSIITTLTLDTERGNELFNMILATLHVLPSLFPH